MRIVVNTILNSLIKEFIKLIANYSKGYKKLINFSLPTYPLREEKILFSKACSILNVMLR